MNVTDHDSVEASKASFLEQFEEGIEGDSWMAAVWTLKDFNTGKAVDLDEYVVRKTTNNFPKGKYLGALFSLKAVLDKEIVMELASVQQPLPLAPHLRNKLPGKVTALHEVNQNEPEVEKDPFTPEISPFPELNSKSENESLVFPVDSAIMDGMIERIDNNQSNHEEEKKAD